AARGYDRGNDCSVERRRPVWDLRSAFERRIWWFQRGRLPWVVSVAGRTGREDADSVFTYFRSNELDASPAAGSRILNNPSPQCFSVSIVINGGLQFSPMRVARSQSRSLDIANFRKLLLRWYARHQRKLPWRRQPDPYRILVSEIMLQQTRVAVVE